MTTLLFAVFFYLGQHFDKQSATDMAALEERMYLKYGCVKQDDVKDPFDAIERRQKKLNGEVEEEDESACGRCRACLWAYFKCWDCNDLLSRQRKLRDLVTAIREDHPIVSIFYPLPLEQIFFTRTQKILCFYCEMQMCGFITGYYVGTDQSRWKECWRTVCFEMMSCEMCEVATSNASVPLVVQLEAPKS